MLWVSWIWQKPELLSVRNLLPLTTAEQRPSVSFVSTAPPAHAGLQPSCHYIRTFFKSAVATSKGVEEVHSKRKMSEERWVHFTPWSVTSVRDWKKSVSGVTWRYKLLTNILTWTFSLTLSIHLQWHFLISLHFLQWAFSKNDHSLLFHPRLRLCRGTPLLFRIWGPSEPSAVHRQSRPWQPLVCVEETWVRRHGKTRSGHVPEGEDRAVKINMPCYMCHG